MVCLRSAKQTHFRQAALNLPDLLLVQPPRLVLAVAGDERDGVPLVEQFHGGLDLAKGNIQAASHLSQVNRYRTFHKRSILPGDRNRIFLEKDQTRKMPLGRYIDGTDRVGTSRKEAPMKASHLRVYYGPQEESANVSVVESQRETVTVPLMEIMPLLADAVQSQRTWLRDFADDEVTISMDLYEVLLAYQHYRRPSA